MRRLLPPWRIGPAAPERPPIDWSRVPLAGFCDHGIGMLEDCKKCCPPPPGPSGDALACIADLEEQVRVMACSSIQLAEEKAELSAQLAELRVRTQGLAAYAASLEEERAELRTARGPDVVALHDRLAQLQQQNERLYVELGVAQGRDMSQDFTTPNGSPPLARSRP